MSLAIPNVALIVLIGPSGAGKSTFAAKHFRPTEVVSSDECRALVADDENDQAATPAAFRVLHAIVRERMHQHRMTVVDATNVKPMSRKPLIASARRYGVPTVAIVFDLPLKLCLERNRNRASRSLTDGVVRRQHEQMKLGLVGLPAEGFDAVHVLGTAAAVDAVSLAS
ncbi:MAG TPA: AAA family ATPase [Candidatus Dormibacteraeota bacterium]|nr:AAA family ATPase [Candidatus Dormibacteraeota bacterium]